MFRPRACAHAGTLLPRFTGTLDLTSRIMITSVCTTERASALKVSSRSLRGHVRRLKAPYRCFPAFSRVRGCLLSGYRRNSLLVAVKTKSIMGVKRRLLNGWYFYLAWVSTVCAKRFKGWFFEVILFFAATRLVTLVTVRSARRLYLYQRFPLGDCGRFVPLGSSFVCGDSSRLSAFSASLCAFSSTYVYKYVYTWVAWRGSALFIPMVLHFSLGFGVFRISGGVCRASPFRVVRVVRVRV